MSDLKHHRRCRPEIKAGPRSPVPDVYMPATWPVGLFETVTAWGRAWMRRRRFLRTLDLDERILKDLGYSRDELYWASRLPLCQDAARALLERRRERPGGR